MAEALRAHPMEAIPHLQGAWVAKNSNYEHDICRILRMEQAAGRYWDARWNGRLIEFKKAEASGSISSATGRSCSSTTKKLD